MKAKFYKFSLFFMFLILGNSVYGQYELLYVGGSETAPEDSALLANLTDVDYTVTFVASSAFNTTPYDTPEAYDGFDAIFFSEIIGSSDVVNFKTAGFPIPSVVTEGFAVRDNRWGMIDNNDSTNFYQLGGTQDHEGANALVVVDNSHYITNLFEVDDEILWTTAPDSVLGITSSNLENVDGALPLLVYKNEKMMEIDLPTLWAIPGGSSYTSSVIADAGATIDIPENMVMFGSISTGIGEFATEEFYNLIFRCLEWVTGNVQVGIHATEIYNLAVGPNPTNGLVNISLTLPVSGNVQINVFDITGKLVLSKNAEYLSSGYNTLSFNLSNMPTSQYIYQIVTQENVLTGKINKLK